MVTCRCNLKYQHCWDCQALWIKEMAKGNVKPGEGHKFCHRSVVVKIWNALWEKLCSMSARRSDDRE